MLESGPFPEPPDIGADHGGEAPDGFRSAMATIMFTDIEDSTGLATALGMAEFARFLVDHLGLTHRIVLAHGGIVQNFTGDGVLILWLATQMTPNETAHRALRAAIELTREITTVNAHQRLCGRPARRIRIGLHSGEVMLGRRCGDRHSIVTGAEVIFTKSVEEAGKTAMKNDAEVSITASGAALHLAGIGNDLLGGHDLVRLPIDRISCQPQSSTPIFELTNILDAPCTVSVTDRRSVRSTSCERH